MKVSVVGLGIMGAAIAAKLVEGGHQVTVNNRTREKAAPLLAMGARWADTPGDAARESDVTISMVTDPDAARAVALGDGGIAGGLPQGAVHAEMSTISPQAAGEIANAYQERSLRYVQAPVLGSRPQIEQGKLLIIAGGDSSEVEICRPVWMTFAQQVWAVGDARQAAAMKLACNMLMGQMIVGLGQSLAFVKKFGMEPREYLDIIGKSALAAPQYQAKGQAILKGEYPPNFTVPNLLKDLRLGAEAAREYQVELPLNGVAQEIFVEAIAQNYADEDYAAVVKVIAGRAGVNLAEAH